MAKREKNDAPLSEKFGTNAEKKETIKTVAPILRGRSAGLAALSTLVGLAFLCGELGCVRWGRGAKESETAAALARTETALCVDARVSRMEIAKNSKRILVELRDFDDPTEDAYLEFFASGGERVPSVASSEEGAFLELWNVEFLEARREDFDATQPSVVGAATFNDAGTRVFWTTREIDRSGGVFATAEGGTAEEKNASASGFRGFATASEVKTANWEGGGENGVESVAATFASSAGSANKGLQSAFYRGESVLEPASRTVLATRAFEGPGVSEERATGTASGTRLKISEEAKGADSVWLSPNARWIVGRVGASGWTGAVEGVGENGENGENEGGEGSASGLTVGEWALTLRQDRRRVVRFPQPVKMTFAESTSNETIEGRVVDVLAVSNAGDLAATLVEETGPTGASGEDWGTRGNGALDGGAEIAEEAENARNGEEIAATSSDGNRDFNGRAGFAPRFKIVIWDLSVPETVDWEKAKKPLQAVEVAQIPVAGPVSRRFCRFSPNGQIFASRIDPRYVSLWQSANGRILVELGEHESDVSDFAFSPNGMKVAAATGTGKRVLLWNVRKAAPHRTLVETSSEAAEIDAVAFSPDGGSVFFANDLGEIKRWDARAERRSTVDEGERTTKKERRRLFSKR